MVGEVIVVSGIPRSGTSMMMRMLSSGGVPLLEDGIREPDEHNPHGYYEFERVKQLARDKSWLADARGKAVKVIYALLRELPDDYRYKVIFMQRPLEEVVASQDAMMAGLGTSGGNTSSGKIIAAFRKQLTQIDAWLAARPHFDLLQLGYHQTMADPASAAERIDAFLDGHLDQAAMREAVDPSLCRQRSLTTQLSHLENG